MSPNATKSGAASLNIDRGTAPGRATRELLICTAERLFAERGIHGVSLREIALEAGQRNNAVIEYHFGTRNNLVAAIYTYRANSLNQRCFELLMELTEKGELEDTSALLKALLLPHIENLQEPDNHFLGFLARALTDEARLNVTSTDEARPELDALMLIRSHIRQCLPNLTAERFELRMAMVVNWAVHGIAEFARDHPKATREDLGVMLSELVVMLDGALRANSIGVT